MTKQAMKLINFKEIIFVMNYKHEQLYVVILDDPHCYIKNVAPLIFSQIYISKYSSYSNLETFAILQYFLVGPLNNCMNLKQIYVDTFSLHIMADAKYVLPTTFGEACEVYPNHGSKLTHKMSVA